MSLTEVSVKTAQGQTKAFRLYDSAGLYLEVTPSGAKYWRFKYRYANKEKRLALGVYPEIGLKLARQRRDSARQLLNSGIDPSVERRAQKMSRNAAAGNSFEVIAREWLESRRAKWVPAHAVKVLHRIEKNLLPWLGNRPVLEITPPELLAVLRKAEQRGKLETARRARQIASQIFRYAIATSRAERDPTQDLRGALAPPTAKHLAAITDPRQVGPLLAAIDGYSGSAVVCAALRIAPLVFVRPGELRRARWAEFDFAGKLWRIPAERMKGKEPHIVPLSAQAMGVLNDLQPVSGMSEYVFPGARSMHRPMSENAINAALRYIGFDSQTMCGHGFRAMARTILDEVLNVRVDIIEHQLGHAVLDANGRAYNRTSHLEARRTMMQSWADYLDSLKSAQDARLRATGLHSGSGAGKVVSIGTRRFAPDKSKSSRSSA